MMYFVDNTARDARVYDDRGRLVTVVEEQDAYDEIQDDLRLAGLLREGDSLALSPSLGRRDSASRK